MAEPTVTCNAQKQCCSRAASEHVGFGHFIGRFVTKVACVRRVIVRLKDVVEVVNPQVLVCLPVNEKVYFGLDCAVEPFTPWPYGSLQRPS